jgi:light-regulated signal transduction histidine kinase (bacteriophytochrome)
MIAIYSQLLERKYRGKISDDADEYLNIIVQGAKRMEMLLKDLLSYAKAINISPEPGTETDANEAAAKALSNLSAALRESEAKVSVGQLPALNVREVHLVQLFQNLIGNAIKYRGEDAPAVEVTAKRENDEWTFNVKDNGIGIPPQYQEHIFRVFKRLHGLDKYEGTGMGLAICQRIVERYGGRIWVESQEGHGATFHFTLPARSPRANPVSPGEKAADNSPAAAKV